MAETTKPSPYIDHSARLRQTGTVSYETKYGSNPNKETYNAQSSPIQTPQTLLQHPTEAVWQTEASQAIYADSIPIIHITMIIRENSKPRIIRNEYIVQDIIIGSDSNCDVCL